MVLQNFERIFYAQQGLQVESLALESGMMIAVFPLSEPNASRLSADAEGYRDEFAIETSSPCLESSPAYFLLGARAFRKRTKYATRKHTATINSKATPDIMPMIIYIPSLLFVDDLFDGGTAVGAAVGGI